MQALSMHRPLTELSQPMQAFIQRQEMMFLATYAQGDQRDCTFVAGGPGFVRVLDVNRLAWPEFPDGESAAGLLAQRPEVSLLFVDFLRGGVGLHVEGRAKVLDDRAMRRAYRHLDDDLVADRRPARWITVYVEDVYAAEGTPA